MDQKYITKGGLATGIVLLVLGLVLIPVALGLAATRPDQIWIWGIFLLGACSLLIVSGIRSIREASQQARESEAQVRILGKLATLRETTKTETYLEKPAYKLVHQAGAAQPGAETADRILASWKYAPGEWGQFETRLRKETRAESIIAGLLLALLGGFLFKEYRGSNWWTMFAVAAALGLVFGVLNYRLGLASIGKPGNAHPLVVLTPTAVMINNRLNPLWDNTRWLSKVKIVEEPDPKLLEFTVNWETRKGLGQEEIRVPIPRGKLGEAVLLLDQFRIKTPAVSEPG